MAVRRVVVMGLEEYQERLKRHKEEYMEMWRKYEGFETCGYGIQLDFNGLIPRICGGQYPPCRGLVLLYARLGLHRYNLLHGKNFQLIRVKKYNKTFGGASIYYITLEAEDPAIPASLQTFQARVNEDQYRTLLLNCCIARPLGETKKTNKKSLFSETFGGKFLHQLMPELPSENPFKNTSRFYVLDKSEQQAHDWIQLYLDLAVATANRSVMKDKYAPTNLKILKVSIETTQDPETPNHGHDVYDATFYIRYKDTCRDRVGTDFDRIAVIRRILDKNTGDLRLAGRTESSETIIPKMAKKNLCEARVGCKVVDLARKADAFRLVACNKSSVAITPRKAKKNHFRPLLGVRKPWRLFTLGGLKSYKICVVGSARRLHKTRSI